MVVTDRAIGHYASIRCRHYNLALLESSITQYTSCSLICCMAVVRSNHQML